MSSSSFPLLAVCIFPFILAWNCNNLPWKDWNVQLIDDCEILKDEVTIQLDRWLNKELNCLESLAVSLDNYEIDIDRPGSGYQRVLTFRNPLPLNKRCKQTPVFMSTRVCFNGNCVIHKTNFWVTPSSRCTSRTHGVEFKEPCSDNLPRNPTSSSTSSIPATSKEPNSDVQTTTSIPAKTNLTDEEAQPSILPFISIGIGLLLAILVVAILFWRRMKANGMKVETTYNIDENHVYGTYSRGWEEEGEYGDGDVVEITDTNHYYQ